MTHPDHTPGHPENIPGSPNPSFDCLTGRHMLIDVYDAKQVIANRGQVDRQLGCVASWCLWCGSGMSDPARVDDTTGQPIGFAPIYDFYAPDDWHRDPTKGSLPS
jgi:hypothetical protein